MQTFEDLKCKYRMWIDQDTEETRIGLASANLKYNNSNKGQTVPFMASPLSALVDEIIRLPTGVTFKGEGVRDIAIVLLNTTDNPPCTLRIPSGTIKERADLDD